MCFLGVTGIRARVYVCVCSCVSVWAPDATFLTAASAEHLWGEQFGVGLDTPALGWDRILSFNLDSPLFLGGSPWANHCLSKP